MPIYGNMLSLPNPKPKLDNFSNALKGTKSGEAIGITDISPIEHNMGVSVRGKNLIPYPYFDTTKTVSGITYTDNGDGSITINGTAGSTSEVFYLTSSHSTADIGDLFEDGKTYRIATAGAATFVLNCKTLADGKDKYYYAGNTFTVDKSTYRYMHLRLQVTNKTVDNAIVYPMIEEGTTATSYAPYIADISTVKLYKQGKNLFNNDTSLMKEISYIGTDGVERKRNGYEVLLPVGTYTIKATPNTTYSDTYIYSCVVDKNNNFKQSTNVVLGNYEQAVTFNIEKGDALKVFDGVAQALITSQSRFKKFDIQVEIGETATEYEPYIEPTVYDVSADGTVEGVKSIYPNTTLYTDTSGAVIDAEYNRDINKAFAELQNAILAIGGLE